MVYMNDSDIDRKFFRYEQNNLFQKYGDENLVINNHNDMNKLAIEIYLKYRKKNIMMLGLLLIAQDPNAPYFAH